MFHKRVHIPCHITAVGWCSGLVPLSIQVSDVYNQEWGGNLLHSRFGPFSTASELAAGMFFAIFFSIIFLLL